VKWNGSSLEQYILFAIFNAIWMIFTQNDPMPTPNRRIDADILHNGEVFGPAGLLVVMDLSAGCASTFSQVEKAASPIEILAAKSHRIFPSWFSRIKLYPFPLKKFNKNIHGMLPWQSRI